MNNPFDLQKNDAAFVAGARNKRSRQNQITRLSIGRSWILMLLLIQTGFIALLFALDWRHFAADNQIWLWVYVMNIGSLSYVDLQIKFLKTLEIADVFPSPRPTGTPLPMGEGRDSYV